MSSNLNTLHFAQRGFPRGETRPFTNAILNVITANTPQKSDWQWSFGLVTLLESSGNSLPNQRVESTGCPHLVSGRYEHSTMLNSSFALVMTEMYVPHAESLQGVSLLSTTSLAAETLKQFCMLFQGTCQASLHPKSMSSPSLNNVVSFFMRKSEVIYNTFFFKNWIIFIKNDERFPPKKFLKI